VFLHSEREDKMAKGQLRSNREKKKPKAEKNKKKKKKGAPAVSPFASTLLTDHLRAMEGKPRRCLALCVCAEFDSAIAETTHGATRR
jgi:hypothetical protein